MSLQQAAEGLEARQTAPAGPGAALSPPPVAAPPPDGPAGARALSPDQRAALARLLLAGGKPGDALAAVDAALLAAPGSLPLLHLRGSCLAALGNVPGAAGRGPHALARGRATARRPGERRSAAVCAALLPPAAARAHPPCAHPLLTPPSHRRRVCQLHVGAGGGAAAHGRAAGPGRAVQGQGPAARGARGAGARARGGARRRGRARGARDRGHRSGHRGQGCGAAGGGGDAVHSRARGVALPRGGALQPGEAAGAVDGRHTLAAAATSPRSCCSRCLVRAAACGRTRPHSWGLDCARVAVGAKPCAHLPFPTSQGVVASEAGRARWPEALECYTRAVECNPAYAQVRRRGGRAAAARGGGRAMRRMQQLVRGASMQLGARLTCPTHARPGPLQHGRDLQGGGAPGGGGGSL